MAPEQHRGEPAFAAADQFSFCVSLYEAIYGERPFSGHTLDELSRSVLGGVLPKPSHKRAPPWIYDVLARGLRVSPSERHSSMAQLLEALDRDPARARRRWLVVLGVIAACLLMLFSLWRTRALQRSACREAAAKLAGAWDEPRRRAMHAAFIATRTAFAEATFAASARALDAYAAAWRAMRIEACEATRVRGEQSEDLLDLRMACLDARREDLRETVDLFTRADPSIVERASKATQALPGLDECKNTAALRQIVRPPPDANTRARVEALRTRLSAARTRRHVGKYAESQTMADAIITEAHAIKYPPLEAQALQLRGFLEIDRRDYKAALETFLAAAESSDAGNDDRARERALRLLSYVNRALDRFSEAHAYLRLAKAALTRAGSDRREELMLEQYEADMLAREHRYDEALMVQQRVLDRVAQVFGGDDEQVADSLTSAAVLYNRRGDYREAAVVAQRAITLLRKIYGGDHLGLAMPYDCLGRALMNEGDYPAAFTALEKAIAIDEAVFGRDHPRLDPALANLALTLVNMGRLDEALVAVERAYAIRSKVAGREHESLGYLERTFAEIYLKQRQLDRARDYAQRAIPKLEAESGKDSPWLAEDLTVLSEIRLAQHQPTEAIALGERAVAIFVQAGGEAVARPGNEARWLSRGRFALARALWDSRRDRARALSLAQLARERAENTAEIDAWLRSVSR
jgi:tetratricopeptide (TPR) repeat protein